jgi:hypothetical protein
MYYSYLAIVLNYIDNHHYDNDDYLLRLVGFRLTKMELKKGIETQY